MSTIPFPIHVFVQQHNFLLDISQEKSRERTNFVSFTLCSKEIGNLFNYNVNDHALQSVVLLSDDLDLMSNP